LETPGLSLIHEPVLKIKTYLSGSKIFNQRNDVSGQPKLSVVFLRVPATGKFAIDRSTGKWAVTPERHSGRRAGIENGSQVKGDCRVGERIFNLTDWQ